jgi:hypothetical protein
LRRFIKAFASEALSICKTIAVSLDQGHPVTLTVSSFRHAALALSLAALPALPVMAQNVIKIGEINSYKAQPAFLDP